jgi:hypothetical protein
VAHVREGLSRALTLTPGRGYVELQAGWERAFGAYGRAEAGFRLGPSSSAFGFGQLDQHGPMAGLGFRWEFQ